MENKICVYAICKNEMKFVEKWIENVSGADFIVVLDTGSTDGTYEYLKSNPKITRVEQKEINPWRFDVARNESMKLVPDEANILVCTDFDELFTEGWADIVRETWVEGETNRIHYPYAWSHNQANEPTDVFMYDKIHDRNFHWIYPVHEVLYPIEGFELPQKVRETDKMMLHHYPDKEKSRSSYFNLLKLAVEENPNDPHIRELYAREYLNLGKYEEAMEEFKTTLNLPEINGELMKREKLYCIYSIAKLYNQSQNYLDGLKYLIRFIKEDKTYRDPYLVVAEIFNEMDMPNAALGVLQDALKVTYQHKDWVEDGNTYLEKLDDILSLSYYKLGDIDKAISHIEKAIVHAPNDTRLLKNYCAFLKEKASRLSIKEKEKKE